MKRISGIVLVALAAATRAEELPGVAPGSLSLLGITLYGSIDVGASYDTHGEALNGSFGSGNNDVIFGAKNANKSYAGLTPNNLSLTKVGLKGDETLSNDWVALFKLETGINPLSGQLCDALKSMTQQNGLQLQNQRTGWGDSSRAGQIINGPAFAGITHTQSEALTLGRQFTFTSEITANYDPAFASNAGLLGYAGPPAGGGDAEDRLLDSMIKYSKTFGPLHAGGLYSPGEGRGASKAYQFKFGGEFGHLSVDGVYSKVRDAIASAPLTTCGSAAVAASSPVSACTTPSNLSPSQIAALARSGVSESDTLAATISDNTAFQAAIEYDAGAAKFFTGYEHMMYGNPSSPLSKAGGINANGACDLTSSGCLGISETIGGYHILTNNSNFGRNKVIQIYWAGFRYAFSLHFEIAASYYRENQNNYSPAASLQGCSNGYVSSTCSGSFNAATLIADYKFTKRFNLYCQLVWSDVAGGMHNGYLKNNDVAPQFGARFSF